MEAPCTIQSTQHSHAVAPSIEFIIQNLHSMMIVYTISWYRDDRVHNISHLRHNDMQHNNGPCQWCWFGSRRPVGRRIVCVFPTNSSWHCIWPLFKPIAYTAVVRKPDLHLNPNSYGSTLYVRKNCFPTQLFLALHNQTLSSAEGTVYFCVLPSEQALSSGN